jgi:hypothetical protein
VSCPASNRDDDGRRGRWHDRCAPVRVAEHRVAEEGAGGMLTMVADRISRLYP